MSFVQVNIAEYQPEPGDSIMERRGIFSASIHMLQWLTRSEGNNQGFRVRTGN